MKKKVVSSQDAVPPMDPLPPTHPQAPIPPAQLPLLLPQTEKKKTPQVRKLP